MREDISGGIDLMGAITNRDAFAALGPDAAVANDAAHLPENMRRVLFHTPQMMARVAVRKARQNVEMMIVESCNNNIQIVRLQT